MPSTPHFKHDLHIAAHVRACAHDGQVVLLDLQRSRYLGVGGPLAATLAPVVSGWPGHDNCPHVGTASQANTEALAAPLMHLDAAQIPLGDYAHVLAWFARIRASKAWVETNP